MTTLFIFVDAMDASEFSSLVLAANGDVIHPPKLRSFTELKALTKLGSTRIILSASKCSLHRVLLPLLPDKKAQTAIAYALEDSLAQVLSAVHIAFDKKFYVNGHYLAVVCDKTWFEDVLALFVQQGIETRFITLDWFALKTDEIVLSTTDVLLNTQIFCGALAWPHFNTFWKPATETEYHVLRWTDTVASDAVSALQETVIEEPQAQWIARRLLQMPQINLRQGRFKQKTSTTHLFQGYMIAGLCFSLWLMGTLTFNIWQVLYFNRQIKPLDSEIASVYRQFFPEARQIISPKFRVQQWQKSHQGADSPALFVLLDKIGAAIDLKTMKIQGIDWQNHKMKLTLKTQDFNQLAVFQLKMSQNKLNIVQKQASKKEDSVLSVWELSL